MHELYWLTLLAGFISLATGAAGGSVGGPIGTVIGAIIGGLGSLFAKRGGGGDNQPPPVPLNPRTGQPLSIDQNTGLPSDIMDAIWQAQGGQSPEGMSVEQWIDPQMKIPRWVANRFREVAGVGDGESLPSWFTDMFKDPSWWGQQGINFLTTPWGGFGADYKLDPNAGQSAQPQPNEGRQTDYPQGQEPSPGETTGEPGWQTTTTGQSQADFDQLLKTLGLGGGAVLGGVLPGILGGGGIQGVTPQQPTPVPGWGITYNPQQPQPDTQPSAPYVDPVTGISWPTVPPTFSTTVTGQMPNPSVPPPMPIPGGAGAGSPVPPWGIHYDPLNFPPNNPQPTPISVPGLPSTSTPGTGTSPTTPGTPSTPETPGTPETPKLPAGNSMAAFSTAGGAAMPPGFPVVGGGPQLVSLFGLPTIGLKGRPQQYAS